MINWVGGYRREAGTARFDIWCHAWHTGEIMPWRQWTGRSSKESMSSIGTSGTAVVVACRKGCWIDSCAEDASGRNQSLVQQYSNIARYTHRKPRSYYGAVGFYIRRKKGMSWQFGSSVRGTGWRQGLWRRGFNFWRSFSKVCRRKATFLMRSEGGGKNGALC
jgi:hypothetical protein